ncbi:MAG: hypothetical protein E3K37_09130 [Candidatus Kuenenia sp.]|nr:hypothetical protein [Candidatus Kuenenia hertensis]
MNERLFSELRELYRLFEHDLSLINPRCNKCGSCCNFGKYDHVLYASSVEVNYLERNVDIPDFDISKSICPFLKNDSCGVRDFRMFSCRSFYCDEKHKEETQSLHEKYHRMIKDLYNKYHLEWEYRPFLSLLNGLKSNKLKSCKATPAPDK